MDLQDLLRKCSCVSIPLENFTPNLVKDLPDRRAQGMRWAESSGTTRLENQNTYLWGESTYKSSFFRPSRPGLGTANRLPGQQGRLNWARICRGATLKFVYALIVSCPFLLLSYFLGFLVQLPLHKTKHFRFKNIYVMVTGRVTHEWTFEKKEEKKASVEPRVKEVLTGSSDCKICTVICLVDFISNCHFHGFHRSDS